MLRYLPPLSALAFIFTPQTLTAQSTSKVALQSNRYDDSEYDIGYGRPIEGNVLKARFTSLGRDYVMHVQGFDIDDEQVEITLNGGAIGTLPQGLDGKYGQQIFYWIPSRLQRPGNNTIAFTFTGGDGQ